MDLSRMTVTRPPPLSRITCAKDIERITFVDGIAEVEVPVRLLHLLPLKHEERFDSDRLRSVVRSIRWNGYRSIAPIVCKVGARGRWVVMDGGHRLTALRLVSRDWLTWLLRRDLGDVTFILYTTARSETKGPMAPAA